MNDEPEGLRPPPHPMASWLAALPLPTPPEPEDEGGEEPAEPTTVRLPGMTLEVVDLRRMLRPQQGVEAAIVMEIGPLAPDTADDLAAVAVPYAEGATVYYFADQALRIGDFRYVRIDRVLAWEEPPA